MHSFLACCTTACRLHHHLQVLPLFTGCAITCRLHHDLQTSPPIILLPAPAAARIITRPPVLVVERASRGSIILTILTHLTIFTPFNHPHLHETIPLYTGLSYSLPTDLGRIKRTSAGVFPTSPPTTTMALQGSERHNLRLNL